VGVAGITGAVALILSAYGLAVLPTSWFGLGLIGLAVFGYSVDVQAGAPRTWTGIGVVSLLVGSWRLFPGGLAVPWLVIVLVAGGTALFMLSGMTAMLRARFSTPTIGRESMIGEMGQATTGIDPEGMVDLRGGKWRARTNRATPINAGDRIRVVAIDGLLLEVEPETGGAKDAHH
jgi:membrane-bound serine protease (ClpP class)